MGKLLLELKNNSLATRASSDDTDLFGSTNMFGSIAHKAIPISTSMSFIPEDNAGAIIDLKGTNVNAKWLGLDNKMMQFWAYNYCSPLAAVIDRLAEADTNGRIKLLKPDDTVYENYTKNPVLNRLMKLLKKPNPWQTWEEYNSEQLVISKVFGYCPVWSLGPFGMDKSYTKALFNLNPFFFNPIRNIEFSPFIENSNPIKEWNGTIFGFKVVIPSSDVMLLKDGLMNSSTDVMGLPLSKVAGLDYFISNICAAMEADNVLLKKKGPLGVFSHDPKPDMAGWTPMKPQDKNDLQDDLKRYGLTLGQLQYIVSKTPIKWNAMSFNLRDLMTKETVRQGIDGICDRLGYPAELMSGKNATYENRNSAEKYLYQNNIIPFSLRRMAQYDKFFGLEDMAALLYLDYDHLPVLQDDIVKAANANYSTAQRFNIEWKAGLITLNEWRLAQKMLPLSNGEGDWFYPEWFAKYGKKLNLVKNDTAPKNPSA